MADRSERWPMWRVAESPLVIKVSFYGNKGPFNLEEPHRLLL